MSRIIFNVAAKCDRAGRAQNQDNYWICPDLSLLNSDSSPKIGNDTDIELSEKGTLLVVADGMGGRTAMEKIVVKVDGMQCGMCEAHVNEAVRAAFPVKKVTSSHAKGETVILTEQDIDDAKLKEVIDKTGYEIGTVTREPYEKKGLFSAFRHEK